MYGGGGMLGRRAGSSVGKYITESTKQQKVQHYYEDYPLCPSSEIIHLCYKLVYPNHLGNTTGKANTLLIAWSFGAYGVLPGTEKQPEIRGRP